MPRHSYTTVALVLALLAMPLTAKADDTTDIAMVEQLATELAAAAPMAQRNDANAYAVASRRLTDSKLLETISDETILWGVQTEGKGLNPDQHNLNRFDPRVWRGEYLAEFMFSGTHSIERAEGYTVLKMECGFRNGMDAGDYPYPFWHSQKKWRSYQLTRRLLFLFEKGKLIAAYRSFDEDPSRPMVARTFDGIWHWSSKDHPEEPHVSLYENILSKDNPHLASLEDAYRKLEATSRQSNCMKCHSPDNAAGAKKLTLLSFPNQALAARRTLVKQLEEDLMPPKDEAKHTPGGIGDAAEKAKLIEIAKVFTTLADKALEFEKVRVLGTGGR